MPNLDDLPGVENGAKVPILPVLLVLVTAAVAALTSWVFRVDDRLYDLIRDVPTRAEIQLLRADLASRLDRIEGGLSNALATPRPSSRP